MKHQTITVTVDSKEFAIRPEFKAIAAELAERNYRHIQELICHLFLSVDDLLSDEYALAIYMFFPNSAVVDNRLSRAAADVRKFNNRDFTIQKELDCGDHVVALLDGGSRSGGGNKSHAADILKQLD